MKHYKLQWSHSQVKGFGLTIEPAVMKNSQRHDWCNRRDAYCSLLCYQMSFVFKSVCCKTFFISLVKHSRWNQIEGMQYTFKTKFCERKTWKWFAILMYTHFNHGVMVHSSYLYVICCGGFVRRETRSTTVLLDCQLSYFNRYRCCWLRISSLQTDFVHPGICI